MRIVEARPLASPRICPRGPLDVAALGEMKQSMSEPGEENESPTTERVARMNWSPGGRSRVIFVRVTDLEDLEIRRRAAMHRRSAQRFLIETALSGSAQLAAERSRAQGDAETTRIILARLANNVNQLAKWANTNHALPDTFADALTDIRRATEAVAETTERLSSSFQGGRYREREGIPGLSRVEPEESRPGKGAEPPSHPGPYRG
jgi:hypothetical protein